MKKLFLAIIVLAIAISANAQFKPSQGDFSAEVNFRPLSTNPIQVDYLKGRMFLNSDMAIRLGLELNSYSETSKSTNTANPPITEETTNKYMIFGLRPGIEFHMKGTDRLSPYYGAEIAFSMKSASTKITNFNKVDGSNVEVNGAWQDGSNMGYTMFGINLLFGADYYVAKHLYLGAEIGFGFFNYSYKDTEVTSGTTTKTTPNGSDMNMGVNFNSAIRLGWAF